MKKLVFAKNNLKCILIHILVQERTHISMHLQTSAIQVIAKLLQLIGKHRVAIHQTFYLVVFHCYVRVQKCLFRFIVLGSSLPDRVMMRCGSMMGARSQSERQTSASWSQDQRTYKEVYSGFCLHFNKHSCI